MSRQTYGPGHPFVTAHIDQTAEGRAEKRKAWEALPKAPRGKRSPRQDRIESRRQEQKRKLAEVKQARAESKAMSYQEKLDAAIARAKAGEK